MKKNKRLFLIFVAGLISLFLGSLLASKKIPEIQVTTIAGESIKLYESKNKFTIINFWATDCPGCIKEMPYLSETYKQFKNQGLEIIAVSMSYDPPNQVLNFSERNKIPFPIVLDVDGHIAKSFENIRITPTSILIDKDGKVLDKVIGEIDFKQLNNLLKKHLLH